MARVFQAKIEGVQPFIFNRYLEAIEVEREIGKTPTDKTKTDAWRQREGALRVYKNGQGLYFPAQAIRATMIRGASAQDIKHIPAKGRAKALWPFIERGVNIEPREMLFGVENTGELHREMVRIPPKTGAMVPKYWPLLKEWNLSFDLVIVDDSLQEESELKAALQAAGLFCGLGTCRNLGYGRFDVTAWEETTETD